MNFLKNVCILILHFIRTLAGLAKTIGSFLVSILSSSMIIKHLAGHRVAHNKDYTAQPPL